MALRFKSLSAVVAVAGTTIAHGLGNTPDEVFCLAATAAGAGQTYRYAVSDATNVYLAQGTSAASVDVYAVRNHTIIQ